MGIYDEKQRLCFALALWNGQDAILKERLFGLTNHEGSHGEDLKELYYYLDNVPWHAYMRGLYKYPQAAFPYQQFLDESKKRTRDDAEFEFLDTGIFDQNRFSLWLRFASITTKWIGNFTNFNRHFLSGV